MLYSRKVLTNQSFNPSKFEEYLKKYDSMKGNELKFVKEIEEAILFTVNKPHGFKHFNLDSHNKEVSKRTKVHLLGLDVATVLFLPPLTSDFKKGMGFNPFHLLKDAAFLEYSTQKDFILAIANLKRILNSGNFLNESKHKVTKRLKEVVFKNQDLEILESLISTTINILVSASVIVFCPSPHGSALKSKADLFKDNGFVAKMENGLLNKERQYRIIDRTIFPQLEEIDSTAYKQDWINQVEEDFDM